MASKISRYNRKLADSQGQDNGGGTKKGGGGQAGVGGGGGKHWPARCCSQRAGQRACFPPLPTASASPHPLSTWGRRSPA